MTRVLEFVVALIMVFVLAVIVGLCLPSHAHIQRSIDISHDPRHIYDVLNNFRRFKDYGGSALEAEDPQVQFSLSGPAYGPGATVSWTGNDVIGDGTLVNKSGNIDITENSTVTWALTNNWHGSNKTFTLTVTPRDNLRVSTVTWSYDVDYGWNLIGRYSQLWIHGDPDTMIQYGLNSLQTMLAGIRNVDYSKVNPGLYRTPATPVLLVSAKAPRNVDDIDTAKTTALKQIEDAMSKLGVKPAGPITTITTDWGDTDFTFDLAVPIDSTTLTIDGKSYDLTKLPPRPTEAELEAAPASSASAGGPASSTSAGAPASASSSGAAAASAAASAPGSLDTLNQLIVDANVRAAMMPAQEVLEAGWTGESSVQSMHEALEAYADTHGYDSDGRTYDQLASMPTTDDEDRIYRVFMPVKDAPAQTPEQIDGRAKPLTALDPSLWTGLTGSSKPAAAPAAKKPEAKHSRKERHHHH
jgi:hypothetical protein